MAHTRRLHSELAEHWQRVVGSRVPRSPRLGPTEPVTRGCQIADLEPLSGGGGGGWGGGEDEKGEPAGETGFLDSHPLSFTSRGRPWRRHLSVSRTSPSQCPIQNTPAITLASSTQSAFTELCVGQESRDGSGGLCRHKAVSPTEKRDSECDQWGRDEPSVSWVTLHFPFLPHCLPWMDPQCRESQISPISGYGGLS